MRYAVTGSGTLLLAVVASLALAQSRVGYGGQADRARQDQTFAAGPTSSAAEAAAPYTNQPSDTQPPGTALPGALGIQPRRTEEEAAPLPPRRQPAEMRPRNATQLDESAAQGLIELLSRVPGDRRLAGVPLTLAEATRDARTREAQEAQIAAYWDLSIAVTDYYLAEREAGELASLRQAVARPSTAWDDAHRAQEIRVDVAKQSAQAAQSRLQYLLGGRTGNLPLPADMPCCERYETNYNLLFAGQPSQPARQLHQLLPLRYQELQVQTAGVSQAYEWLNYVSENRDPNTDGQGLLRAHDLWSLRRRAFLDNVRDYNQRIAQYAAFATPELLSSNRLVAIHIGERTFGDGVSNATAEFPVDGQPRSARKLVIDQEQPQEDPAEAKAESHERSILVQPKGSSASEQPETAE